MMPLNLTKQIHPEGWRFVGIFAGIAVLLSLISGFMAWVGAILTVWCMYFFRNPERAVPQKDGFVVSPADGRVVLIEDHIPPAEFGMGDEPLTRVSVFLNVFNVHVNRAPIGGKISRIIYHPGKFLNASFDKASNENERSSMVIETADQKKIACIQIAGLIARRIVTEVSQGEELKTGQQYGLIRFGSRCDVYLPKGVKPNVAVGQTAIAGETVLADLNADQSEPLKVEVI